MSNIFVGDNNALNTPPSYDSECFNNFVNELADDVTGSCMIPMNLPKKEVQNKTKEPVMKEIVKDKKPKKDIPLRAKNDPRQRS